MCWGGIWLYLATNDQKYLTAAESKYIPGAAWGQSWDEKISGAMVGIRTFTFYVLNTYTLTKSSGMSSFKQSTHEFTRTILHPLNGYSYCKFQIRE